ncbi:Uncharacterised protein [Legionella quateirensis]|uniref:Uncharacterized protein n=1 Tax=Legionella quateirensis TaxID=45072 RepID=A0A378KXK1_9GAMM|nr:hypothetical protein Lqua_2442 [Legionella quateirensis]STY18889.1 Uncharacterised protein [Legionella quateirensis]
MKSFLIGCIPGIIMILILTLVNLTPKPSLSDPAWEIVPTPNSTSDIIRTRVPHGWLVAYRAYFARGLVYIPDDKHEWKVK